MRGVLLVNGLGANLNSIGKAKATGIEVFLTNDTVSFTRNGIALIEGRRAGKTLNHLNIQPVCFTYPRPQQPSEQPNSYNYQPGTNVLAMSTIKSC
jgi:hypothetical protein